jgi:hypothetical protein
VLDQRKEKGLHSVIVVIRGGRAAAVPRGNRPGFRSWRLLTLLKRKAKVKANIFGSLRKGTFKEVGHLSVVRTKIMKMLKK